MDDRSKPVDIAKGIGILFVVLGHSWMVMHDKGEAYRVIFSFHMPLFFFLSGLYLKPDEGILTIALSRIASLMKPYWVVLVLVGLVHVGGRLVRGQQPSGWFWYFGGVVYGSGASIHWVALWFLPHLFLATIVAALYLRLMDRGESGRGRAWAWAGAAAIYVLGVCIVDSFWRLSLDVLGLEVFKAFRGLPWSADLLPLTVPLMVLGYLSRSFVTTMKFNPAGLWAAVMFFGFLHLAFADTMDLNDRVYTHGVVTTLEAVAGVYGVLNVSCLLARFNWIADSLAFLGGGSLLILIFHKFFQDSVFVLLLTYFEDRYSVGVAAFMMAVLLSAGMVWLVRRQVLLSRLLLPQRRSAS